MPPDPLIVGLSGSLDVSAPALCNRINTHPYLRPQEDAFIESVCDILIGREVEEGRPVPIGCLMLSICMVAICSFNTGSCFKPGLFSFNMAFSF